MDTDAYREKRKESQERRATYRENAEKILTENGIDFIQHTKAHYSIQDRKYDLWPGTGLWIERATGKRGRGIFNLIKLIK